MCNWLEDAIAFWFPELVEQDMDGEPCASIPDSGGADPLKSVSGKQASAPPAAQESVEDNSASINGLVEPPEIPEHLRRLPAVAEAEKIVSRR